MTIVLLMTVKISHHGYRLATMILILSHLSESTAKRTIICYYYSTKLHKRFNSQMMVATLTVESAMT